MSVPKTATEVTMDTYQPCFNQQCRYYTNTVVGNCGVFRRSFCGDYIPYSELNNIAKKPVVKYPNVFFKYSKLPDVVKSILKDRGKGYQYYWLMVCNRVIHLFCKTPEGVVLAGISFCKKGVEFDMDKGLKIAAGRLEATLKFYEKTLGGK